MNPTNLREVLIGLQNVGHETIEFSVLDGTITGKLSTFSRDKDALIQAWASEEESNMIEFTRRWQIGILSNAIVELNGSVIDQNGFVETGKTAEGEAPEKVPIHIYLRNEVLNTWHNDVIMAIMRFYKVMESRAEIKAMKGVKLDYPDIDLAISEAEAKLGSLQKLKESIEVKEAEEEDSDDAESKPDKA